MDWGKRLAASAHCLDDVTLDWPSPTADETFDYDVLGNLTEKSESAGGDYPTLTYGAGAPGPHAVTSAQPASGTVRKYEYDDNGNQTREYIDNTDPTPDVDVRTFAYNAEAMTAQLVEGATTIDYTYGGAGELVAKDDTVYIGGVYEKDTATGVVTKYYFFGGERVAMREGGTLSFLTTDQLGGTALVTNTSGAMVSRIRYYPFGGVRTQEGTAPATDKLFTGQQQQFPRDGQASPVSVPQCPELPTFKPRLHLVSPSRSVYDVSMVKRGPNTEAGRQAVRNNAWKHGIRSEAVVIGDNFEDPAEWEGIRDGIFEYYDLQGEMEFMLAERIAACLWKLRRVDYYQMSVTLDYMRRSEYDLKLAGAVRDGTLSAGVLPEVDPVDLDFQYARRQIPNAEALNLIMRYESHLHRLNIQTMHALEALQERRRGNAMPLARFDVAGAP